MAEVKTPTPAPPLFIKVERYRDVIQNVHKLKSYALSLRDALDALTEIQKQLQLGLSVTQKALDKFNSIIAGLDTKLAKGKAPETDVKGIIKEIKAETPREIEQYVKALYEQMERIRQELQAIPE